MRDHQHECEIDIQGCGFAWCRCRICRAQRRHHNEKEIDMTKQTIQDAKFSDIKVGDTVDIRSHARGVVTDRSYDSIAIKAENGTVGRYYMSKPGHVLGRTVDITREVPEFHEADIGLFDGKPRQRDACGNWKDASGRVKGTDSDALNSYRMVVKQGKLIP